MAEAAHESRYLTMLCLAAAALAAHIVLPLQSFTLAWTHSIEKVRWEEDYRILGSQLELIEARIRGSGAGMEPPADATLKDGVWHYRPQLAPLPAIILTRSPYAADYSLCWEGRCHPMKEWFGLPRVSSTVEMRVCGESVE